MNLQTITFVALIDSLFKNKRDHHVPEELDLLENYNKISDLLFKEYNDDETADRNEDRNEKRKELDIAFHKYFRRLHSSFKKVRCSYLRISPGLEDIYVNSVPSVMNLIGIYSKRTQMLQRGC